MGLKEPFNSVSHMVGGALAVAGLPVLMVLAQGPLAIVACAVYGFGLLAMFTMSAIYHSIPGGPRTEAWLERLDHVAIYLLIAGTYTPVSLLLLGDLLGWVMFGAVWAIAAVGITLSLTVPLGPKGVHVLGYTAMGWLAVIATPALLDRLPWHGLLALLGGGIVYSLGGLLYVRDRPRLWGPFGDHEVWHVLVMVGAALHFAFVTLYVL